MHVSVHEAATCTWYGSVWVLMAGVPSALDLDGHRGMMDCGRGPDGWAARDGVLEAALPYFALRHGRT